MAWHNRGVTLNEWGRYQKAIKSFDRALAIQPNHYKAWLNRGIAWEKLEHYEDALISYNRAGDLQPNDPTIWYNKARCLILQNNVEAAIENLQQAISLCPETYLQMIKTQSDFDNIRSDERFQALLQEQSH
jgi:tetratricopeptide (TPR) repeat protein